MSIYIYIRKSCSSLLLCNFNPTKSNYHETINPIQSSIYFLVNNNPSYSSQDITSVNPRKYKF